MAKRHEMLAINGGIPVRTSPLLPGWPGGLLIGEEERRAVIEVLDSQTLFRHYGPKPLNKVRQFERTFADVIGAGFALGVTSGTAALIVGLAALGVGPGDEVIVPTFTWVATINAVVSLGAVPVFVDIDDTLTINATKIEAAITDYTRAIIPVHTRGAAAAIDRIVEIVRRHNVRVLEDSAQAVGGTVKGRALGTWGDIGAFSLQYQKTITAGEGGVVVTNDSALYERCVRYHDQGALRMEELDTEVPNSNEMVIGVNYRMNEISGALGLVQLTRMRWIIEQQRRHKAAILDSLRALREVRARPIIDPVGDVGCSVDLFLPSRDTAQEFHKALNAEGIRCGVIDGQRVYSNFEQIMERRFLSGSRCAWDCPRYKGSATIARGMFPTTDEILSRWVWLSVNPLFTERDESDIVRGVRKVASAMLVDA